MYESHSRMACQYQDVKWKRHSRGWVESEYQEPCAQANELVGY